jgi:hypothetical protein
MGEVEWGASMGGIGITRLFAGLPTWTLVYRVEKGERPALLHSVAEYESLVLPPVVNSTIRDGMEMIE